MIKSFCNSCYNYIKCNYCITYGLKIGQELNANATFCHTCSSYGLCGFCDKFGIKKGKSYYKNYVDYIKSCDEK